MADLQLLAVFAIVSFVSGLLLLWAVDRVLAWRTTAALAERPGLGTRLGPHKFVTDAFRRRCDPSPKFRAHPLVVGQPGVHL